MARERKQDKKHIIFFMFMDVISDTKVLFVYRLYKYKLLNLCVIFFIKILFINILNYNLCKKVFYLIY
jgi:hypothetical protein